MEEELELEKPLECLLPAIWSQLHGRTLWNGIHSCFHNYRGLLPVTLVAKDVITKILIKVHVKYGNVQKQKANKNVTILKGKRLIQHTHLFNC